MAVDETKLNEMIGKVITDIGATFHAPLVLIGEKLGLFKSLAAKKMNAEDLATARHGEGQIGDGKIFITNLEECIRIRTGDRGEQAI